MNEHNLDFTWDTEAPTPITQKKEEEVKEEKVEKVEEKKTEEDVKDNKDVKEDKEEDSSNLEEDTSEDDDGNIYLDFYNDLKDKGIFKNVELEEGKELNAETLFDLQQQEIDAEVNSRIDAFADKLGDEGKHFIEYIQNGGKVANYFEAIKSTAIDLDGDLDDEEYQESIIRYKMKKDGRDEEEIEERLEYLSEKGRKKQTAEKMLSTISKDIEEEKKNMIDEAKKRKEEIKERKNSYREALKTSIQEIDNIKGISIPKKYKDDIVDYLTRDAYVSNDGQTITEMQKALYDVFNDTEKSILLAKLLMTDFDLSDFEKSVETKSTKKLRSNLENRIGLIKKEKVNTKSFF